MVARSAAGLNGLNASGAGFQGYIIAQANSSIAMHTRSSALSGVGPTGNGISEGYLGIVLDKSARLCRARFRRLRTTLTKAVLVVQRKGRSFGSSLFSFGGTLFLKLFPYLFAAVTVVHYLSARVHLAPERFLQC